MGINYTFTLRVGYVMDQDEVHKVFEKKIPGEFHFEDRFDPKTGLKVDSVKVWDKRSRTFLVINGEEIEKDTEQVASVLAEILDCDVDVSGSYSTGEFEYNFSIKNKSKLDYIDYGKIDIYNSSMSFRDVISQEKKLFLLETKLVVLGLKPGEPKVYIASSIG